MHSSECSHAIDKLQSVYGVHAYPEARVTLLFKAFQYMDADEFCSLVDYLIAHNRTAPMMPDFLAAMAEMKAQKAREVSKNQSMLSQSKGVRTQTIVSCDKCYRKFMWIGYSSDLSSNAERLCANCKQK